MACNGYKSFLEYSWGGQNKILRECAAASTSDDEDTERSDGVSLRSFDIIEHDELSSEQEQPMDCDDSDNDMIVYYRPYDARQSVEDREDNRIDSDSDHSSSTDGDDDASDRTERSEFDIQSNEDDADINENNNQLLYDGAPITTSEAMIATLNLSLRHNITNAQLADILRLISLVCPEDNNCITTLHTFKKYFSHMKMPLNRHFRCAECFETVETLTCICPACMEPTKITYFIEVPIIPQIQALYKRPGFYGLLHYRFTRNRQNLENYEDIYDGAVYKDLTQPGGLLAGCNVLTLMWYADGIVIFKSSKFSIWVVYLIINELSLSERTKKENVLLVAVWFGDSKPIPNMFLEPLHGELQQLRQGINVCVPNIGEPITVKIFIICGTCDLPAKAMFLNMTQYNGRFGCQKCKQVGEYLRDHRVRVYPYEPFILRIDEETHVHAQQAFNSGFAVCGVKGPSILSIFVHESIRATAVDAMHCVFEGVVKSLLKFWFSRDFSDHQSSLIEHLDLVDRRLKALTPPASIQRLPRSIGQHLAYWKAHELKAWLFYYSIPCINDLMSVDYFNHFTLLVLGISLLSRSSIDPNSLEIASRALNGFVANFEHMYGRRYMSNNLHQLLHLTETVRQFGPLWTTSCFPFENLNGMLKRLVHGSKAAQLQICTAVSMYLNLTTLKSQELVEGRPATSFCESLEYKVGRIKRHHIMDSTYIVGKCTALQRLPDDIRPIFNEEGIRGTKYSCFLRLLQNKVMYSSTEYTRSTRTNSTYVGYSSDEDSNRIGQIERFIRVASCHCPSLCHCFARHYAVLRPCLCENEFSTSIDNCVLRTIHTIVEIANVKLAIEVSKLKAVCFHCRIDDTGKTYLVEPVNLMELE